MVSNANRFLLAAAAIAVAFALSVPISGTVGIIGDASAVPVESVLRIGFTQRIDSMNPYIGINDASYLFCGLVYDQLQAAGNDMERVPNLATEVRAVPESDPELVISGEPYGSVWEFNLTTNATWTDGQPFTADDVAFNFNLNADNYVLMWAYQPYSYWMKEAVVVDSDTVRVHFYDRASGGPMPVAYGDWLGIPILPKHLLETMTPFDIGFSWNGLFPSEDPPLVGTGMFMATSAIYDEWLAGDHITLVRNPNYHFGPDYGKYVQFDKIVLRFFDDITAMDYALRNNQLDVAQFSPQEYRNIYQDIESGTLENVTAFEGPRPDQYFVQLGVNMNNAGPNPSRLDRTIRLTMEMAVNKTYLVEQYYLGTAEPGTTLVSPVSPWHYEPNGTEMVPFEISEANAILEAAGYVDIDFDGIRECTATSYAYTAGLVPLNKKLVYDMMVRREHPEERNIAMYLQYQLQLIGIQANYRILDESQLAAEVYAYTYDTVIWYWSSDPDPNYILFTQTKAAWGGWSDNKYTSASFEENYSMSVAALDPAVRKTYVDNCQRVHYLDVAYIILAYPNQTFAWRTDTFTGWGDWLGDPGRSIMNSWSANPLYFDLVPILPPNTPPINLSITATPSLANVLEPVALNVTASDDDGDLLSFYIEFGDGDTAVAAGFAGFTDTQYANFSHAYASAGTFTVTVWVNDSSGLPGHNLSTTCEVVVQEPIPEFATVLLPCVGVLALVLFVRARRRRPGEPPSAS